MEIERPRHESLSGESDLDQTQDSAHKPSFDETATESEGTPPRFRRNHGNHHDHADEEFPDPEDFNSDVVTSSPIKRDAPEDFDNEEHEEGHETMPADDQESWHPLSDKEAKEEEKRAKKAEKEEKARKAKLEKEEKARMAKAEKEEKARLAKEEKEKAALEKKEKKQQEKTERQSKRQKGRREKKEEVQEKAPARPQVRNPRMMLARVLMLDGETLEVEIEKGAHGQILHDVICENQNLVETDYFGLTFVIGNIWFWLDADKKISHQLKKSEWLFEFRVKFYAPEPSVMKEDITRYFLCQQIRNDINMKKLPCSMLTAAILGSYTAQSEIGDYEPEHANGLLYLEDYQFVPNQTPELLQRIVDLHKVHKGQTPAEADIHFLENSMKLAMYGVDLHQVWDSEHVELMLGVCWAGINIYKDKLRINRFSWPKILKISYKKNRFFLRIRPGEFEHFENTIGFKCRNHIMAKRLWKVAVEQHTFFRKKEPEIRLKHLLKPKFGSRFRYSGRTIHQARTATIDRQSPFIDRSFTLRKSRSMNVGGYGSYRREPGSSLAYDDHHDMNNTDPGFRPEHYRRASGSSGQLNHQGVLDEGSVISSVSDFSSMCSSLPPRGPNVSLYALPPGSSKTKKEYYMIASTERLCESPIEKAFLTTYKRPLRSKGQGQPWRRQTDGHLHPPKGWPALLNSETPHSMNEVQEEEAERGEDLVFARPRTPTIETHAAAPTFEIRTAPAPVMESDML